MNLKQNEKIEINPFKSDIYSLGISVLELAGMEDKSIRQIKSLIAKEEKWDFPFPLKQCLEKKFLDLITQILNPKNEERPEFMEALKIIRDI